jgi:hypothetical protein
MNPQHADSSYVRSARLRSVVVSIDQAIACLSREGTAEDHKQATSDLVSSWAGMVALLALGPPPVVRECPTCTRVGLSAATRCGYCWAELSPPPSAGPDAPAH